MFFFIVRLIIHQQIYNMKRILSIFILFISVIGYSSPLYGYPVHSENEKTDDEVIIFRFLPGDLMFYDSDKLQFRSTLYKALNLINSHKEAIQRGDAVVVIHGYCTSFVSDEINRKAAKNRSNQVKSYFITNYWMKEDFYKTRNHITPYKGMNDIVAVVGVEYKVPQKPVREVCPVQPVASSTAIYVPEVPEQLMEIQRPVYAYKGQEVETSSKKRFNIPLSLKSNLLYDALLMPSLEVEYHFSDTWSASIEGSMAWWHKDSKHRYYQLATILPEVRYRIPAKRDGHYHVIGVFGGFTWYDLENGKTGYQGEAWQIGAGYSYLLPINNFWAFEFGAGIGYLNTKNEEYIPSDGHYAYMQTNRTGYVGPLKLKCAIVFDLYKWFNKKGGAR